MSTRSEFVDFVYPLHDRLKLYDPQKPPTDQDANDHADPAKAIPHGFIDAMIVREEVYVQEQNIPLENELDEDDERSFHWIAYASIPAKQGSPETIAAQNSDRRISTSTKIPIGTVRLVPPPHPPHPMPHAVKKGIDGRKDSGNSTAVHDGKEAYIKLGRLAVMKEFRKAGISKLLIETALDFAREHPDDFTPTSDPTKVEALKQETDHGAGLEWNGLVLVHSQAAPGVQKVWKRYGFEIDESMGEWDEEGIMHVGMWRRMDVSRARKHCKLFPLGSPITSP
ncbi:hypothetical protein EJ03DRAFT_323298 [Teratosphaeria nubilosa]|uniref:N-acetyltransferase domain-containing protein n=1 Tax=Teratosphaeria nubilosa TaxID=161662 RepID=A0A6G1LP53_9PEZI|nr:hypothetical protein EJ03DRAFT_323298 [Teratosphaeria nubilosa]